MDEQQLLDIKNSLDKKKSQLSRLEGALDGVKTRLKDEFGFVSFEKAQARVSEIRRAREVLQKTYDEKSEQFKESFPELL